MKNLICTIGRGENRKSMTFSAPDYIADICVMGPHGMEYTFFGDDAKRSLRIYSVWASREAVFFSNFIDEMSFIDEALDETFLKVAMST